MQPARRWPCSLRAAQRHQLRPAAQRTTVIAVAIADMTAAERDARAIVELISGAAAISTIHATIVQAAIGAKARGQIGWIASVKPAQEAIDRRVGWLPRPAERAPAEDRQCGQQENSRRSAPASTHEACIRQSP